MRSSTMAFASLPARLARRLGSTAVPAMTSLVASLIVNTLARLHSRSCIIDGEAVACDDNGVASFDLIRHQRANDSIFQAQGFRLPFRSLSRLAQNEERKCTGREARW